MEQLNVTCEYCGQNDHAVADCPDLADWRHRQAIEEMLAEAAYYQVPKGHEAYVLAEEPEDDV